MIHNLNIFGLYFLCIICMGKVTPSPTSMYYQVMTELDLTQLAPACPLQSPLRTDVHLLYYPSQIKKLIDVEGHRQCYKLGMFRKVREIQ